MVMQPPVPMDFFEARCQVCDWSEFKTKRKSGFSVILGQFGRKWRKAPYGACSAKEAGFKSEVCPKCGGLVKFQRLAVKH